MKNKEEILLFQALQDILDNQKEIARAIMLEETKCIKIKTQKLITNNKLKEKLK